MAYFSHSFVGDAINKIQCMEGIGRAVKEVLETAVATSSCFHMI